MLSFTDGNGHLFSDLLLTLGGERHDEVVALHSGRKAPLRHAASLPQEGGKIRFEHVFSLRLRVGAGTWCYFQFVGQQRFRLPCDGQGKKAKKRPLCLILYFIINFSTFLLNFERRIASETLASSRKFKVQLQGTPLDFRGY